MARERVSSSSSSGIVSSRNSSHSFAEQQQRIITASSTVDGVVVTVSHSESLSSISSRVVSHFTSFPTDDGVRRDSNDIGLSIQLCNLYSVLDRSSPLAAENQKVQPGVDEFTSRR